MRYAIRTAKNLLLTLIFIYAVTGFFLYYAQDAVILPGDMQEFEECTSLPESAEPLRYEGERFFYANNSDDNLVIFYHGNAESSCGFSDLAGVLEEEGVSYLLTVYPGFAGDEKNPSVSSMLDYTDIIDDFMSQEGYDREDSMIIGYSIGGAPASYHAREGGFSEVFLVSTFNRLSEVARDIYRVYPVGLLLRQDLTNDIWLEEHDGSVTVAYTENDLTVDRKHTERLISRLQEMGKDPSVLRLDISDHGRIMREDEVLGRVRESVRGLR